MPVLIQPFGGESYQLPTVANHRATAQSQPGLMLPVTVGHSVNRRQPRHSCFKRIHCDPLLLGHQSQSFSRSYGSVLPTSLTYIVLSSQRLFTLETCCGYGYGLERESLARGPRSGDYITHSHFQGPAPALRTPQEPWCF